jgi:hypothetical protein
MIPAGDQSRLAGGLSDPRLAESEHPRKATQNHHPADGVTEPRSRGEQHANTRGVVKSSRPEFAGSNGHLSLFQTSPHPRRAAIKVRNAGGVPSIQLGHAAPRSTPKELNPTAPPSNRAPRSFRSLNHPHSPRPPRLNSQQRSETPQPTFIGRGVSLIRCRDGRLEVNQSFDS